MANRSGIVVIIGQSPTTYQWLLDGEVVSTSSTYNVSGFEPGRYTLEAQRVRSGSVIASTIHEFVVTPDIVDPVLQLDFVTYSSTGMLDLISGKNFYSVADSYGKKYAISASSTGVIKGWRNMHYLSCTDCMGAIRCDDAIEGQYDAYYGEVQGLKEYTVTFLTRLLYNYTGCYLYFSNGSFWYFNSAGPNWSGADPSDTIYHKWVRLTYVQERTLDNLPSRRTYDFRVYVDGKLSDTTVLDYSPNGNMIDIGYLRVGSYEDDGGTAYPGEIADLRIYDYPFTTDQVTQLCACDGDYLLDSSTGDITYNDCGGVIRYVEYNEVNWSYMTTSTGVLKFVYSGDTCIGTTRKDLIAPKSEVWAYGELYFPAHMYSSGVPLNPEYAFPGRGFQMVNLHNSDDEWVVHTDLLYDDATMGGTNLVTLEHIEFWPNGSGSGGGTTIALDDRVITRDTWHTIEVYYKKGAGDGEIIFYYDGEEVYHGTNLTLNEDISRYYFGTMLGTHIQPGPYGDGNVWYAKNIYVGDVRYSDYLTLVQQQIELKNYDNNLQFVGFETEIVENESMNLSTVSI